MKQRKLFLEKKGHRNPRLRIHAYAYACFRLVCACFMHAYAYTGICVYARVTETIKDTFFCIKFRFGMNLTLSRSHFKPLFSDYIKPYVVPFQNTQKNLKENIRFTKNSESKRESFRKPPFLYQRMNKIELARQTCLSTWGKVWILSSLKSNRVIILACYIIDA